MSTKKAPSRIPTTKSEGKRRPSLDRQRVLWLAQDIFARTVSTPSTYSTDTLARAALQAANLFWTIAKEKP